jgi:hypothetical protein
MEEEKPAGGKAWRAGRRISPLLYGNIPITTIKVTMVIYKERLKVDDPAEVEAVLRTAIVSLWRRDSEPPGLDGLERLKLKSLLLNLKAVWLATTAPAQYGGSIDLAGPDHPLGRHPIG